jgi:hypothetical protein
MDKVVLETDYNCYWNLKYDLLSETSHGYLLRARPDVFGHQYCLGQKKSLSFK